MRLFETYPPDPLPLTREGGSYRKERGRSPWGEIPLESPFAKGGKNFSL